MTEVVRAAAGRDTESAVAKYGKPDDMDAGSWAAFVAEVSGYPLGPKASEEATETADAGQVDQTASVSGATAVAVAVEMPVAVPA
jgi:hypothetical protein